ncbi:MAG: PAS domain-containing protein [Actinobacteria bacterium]|nr:PAS domain-containing protein [Actinomycetota bacterium]
MNDWAKMMMEQEAPSPDGLGQDYWLAAQLPYAVRQRIEIVFEVLSHLPLKQPVAVVSDAGKTIAFNASLLELVGGASSDLLERHWSGVMPGWPDRARGFRREGEQVFEEHLGRPGGERVWVRVSLGPVVERGEPRAMAYLLFISKPDVETIDHDEVRRLRKSLQLLADMQTDFVVEVDRDGVMTFVSPSFCRAVGAAEKELVGCEFTSRVCADDRAAAVASLAEALKPPFSGEMRARLAAEPGKHLAWQIDAVIGDGIVGLDLVGRAGAADLPAEPAASAVAAEPAADTAPPALEDPRLETIRTCLEKLAPGDQAGFMALARAVADAAGAECVLYNVMRGDAVETAVGWRLPPPDPS